MDSTPVGSTRIIFNPSMPVSLTEKRHLSLQDFFLFLISFSFIFWLQNNQGVTPNVDQASVVVNSIIEGGINIGEESVISHCHLQVHQVNLRLSVILFPDGCRKGDEGDAVLLACSEGIFLATEGSVLLREMCGRYLGFSRQRKVGER